MFELIAYDNARRWLSKASRVDEVKQVCDKAEALRSGLPALDPDSILTTD
jgi:hypothetical protein